MDPRPYIAAIVVAATTVACALDATTETKGHTEARGLDPAPIGSVDNEGNGQSCAPSFEQTEDGALVLEYLCAASGSPLPDPERVPGLPRRGDEIGQPEAPTLPK